MQAPPLQPAPHSGSATRTCQQVAAASAAARSWQFEWQSMAECRAGSARGETKRQQGVSEAFAGLLCPDLSGSYCTTVSLPKKCLHEIPEGYGDAAHLRCAT